MISDDDLTLHSLHFITAHFSFITVHLCSDILGTASVVHQIRYRQ